MRKIYFTGKIRQTSILLTLTLLLSSCGIFRNVNKKEKKQSTKEKKIFREEKDSENRLIKNQDKFEKSGLTIENNDNLKLYNAISEWLGVPHKYGGCTKEGTDCSCFVKNIYEEVYKKALSRGSENIYKECKCIDINEINEGDLLFFKTDGPKINHVGIYLKQDKFVHASTSSGVTISNLKDKYYIKTFFSAGRIK
ncbi:MAG: NlpC/P60 family protein [Bacteroidota bacterium]|nr:NlpC/P60 family protein [Bacteroidota bacterium]